MKLFFIINLLVICSVKGDEVPFIFNYTESANQVKPSVCRDMDFVKNQKSGMLY